MLLDLNGSGIPTLVGSGNVPELRGEFKPARSKLVNKILLQASVLNFCKSGHSVCWSDWQLPIANCRFVRLVRYRPIGNQNLR